VTILFILLRNSFSVRRVLLPRWCLPYNRQFLGFLLELFVHLLLLDLPSGTIYLNICVLLNFQ